MTEVFARLISGETIQNAPFKYFTKSGVIKYLLIDSNVSWHPDGTFNHTRCFVRDDTERRIQKAVDEAEMNKLSLVSAAKDKFIRKIFHEIRTPLHIMYSSLHSHLGESLDLATTVEHNVELHNQVDRICSQLDELYT